MEDSFLLHPHLIHGSFCILHDSYCNLLVMEIQCSFNLHFLIIREVKNLYKFFSYLNFFSWKVSIQLAYYFIVFIVTWKLNY